MKLDKLAKGSVALGVGTVLMLGGAGTFAYWNQSVEAGAGKLTAGDLNLEVKTGDWTDIKGNPIKDINTYKVVPGDTVVYEQELDVTLVGGNIAAKLTHGLQQGTTTFRIQDFVVTVSMRDMPHDNVLTKSRTVTTVTTFHFKNTVEDRNSAQAIFELSDAITFTLQQVHQEGLQTPTPTPSS